MSQKHSYTTADYLPWDTMLNLTRRLFRDGKYRMSLLEPVFSPKKGRFRHEKSTGTSQCFNRKLLKINQ